MVLLVIPASELKRHSLGSVGYSSKRELKRHSLGSVVVHAADLAVLQLAVDVPDVGAVQFLYGSHQLREDTWHLDLDAVHGGVTQRRQQALCACPSLAAVLHGVAVVKGHASTRMNPVCEKDRRKVDLLVSAMQLQ